MVEKGVNLLPVGGVDEAGATLAPRRMNDPRHPTPEVSPGWARSGLNWLEGGTCGTSMLVGRQTEHRTRGRTRRAAFCGKRKGCHICNLCNHTTAVDAMRGLFRSLGNRAGNLEAGEVYTDRMAPIVTRDGGIHMLRKARWGLPSSIQVHSYRGIDRRLPNVRDTASPHRRRWLVPQNRCLVTIDRFAETRPGKGAGNAWFRLVDNRPAFPAGIWAPGWTRVAK
jgi:hypothetical protein